MAINEQWAADFLTWHTWRLSSSSRAPGVGRAEPGGLWEQLRGGFLFVSAGLDVTVSAVRCCVGRGEHGSLSPRSYSGMELQLELELFIKILKATPKEEDTGLY